MCGFVNDGFLSLRKGGNYQEGERDQSKYTHDGISRGSKKEGGRIQFAEFRREDKMLSFARGTLEKKWLTQRLLRLHFLFNITIMGKMDDKARWKEVER
jgi:hypothetical protein